MSVTREYYGTTYSGELVEKFTLANANGISASFISLGGIWLTMYVPDQNGQMDDVVLGLDRLEDYLQLNTGPCYGAIIGRNSNRIAGAQFSIGEKVYRLASNERGNNIHSGPNLFLFRVWQGNPMQSQEGACVEFSLKSPDGDQGFPGNALIRVRYTLTDANSIVVDYRMTCDKDTMANFTNHSFFNLAGHGSGDILKHELYMNASHYTPADASSIPTGEIAPVAGTPLDFTAPKPIGQDIDADFPALHYANGYDQNWVLDHQPGELGLAAIARDPGSGRVLEVYTNCPGLQFYTANALKNGIIGKNGAVYGPRHGFCLETQNFPDACHKKNFPSPFLMAGEEYHTRTVFTFRTGEILGGNGRK